MQTRPAVRKRVAEDMASPVDNTDGIAPDDVTLTAWLDGELASGERAALDRRLAAEPHLRARLEFLRQGDRAFGPVYDALLSQAPAGRLDAALASLVADRGHAAPAAAALRRWRVAAAAVAIFAVGAIAGYVTSVATAPPPPYLGWRQTVAEYHALISPETLAVISEDQAELATELASIGGRMALDLSPEQIALPDATLKRAQLYDYRGAPLVQLVYQSLEAGPIALCIIANGREDAGLDFEERVGSNIVYWSKDGRGYMLISKTATRDQLEAYAGDIAARFS